MIWTESLGESENDSKGEADRSKYGRGGEEKIFSLFFPLPTPPP